MTSLFGTPVELNYPFQFDIPDWRGSKERPVEDPDTIMGKLAYSKEFRLFTQLVYESGFDTVLRNSIGPKITVFAVPDAKFLQAQDHIIRELDYQSKRDLISFHILPFEITLRDMKSVRQYLKTLHPTQNLLLNGLTIGRPKLGVRQMSNTVSPTVNYDTEIIAGDFAASNGVIHIISLPMFPNGSWTANGYGWAVENIRQNVDVNARRVQRDLAVAARRGIPIDTSMPVVLAENPAYGKELSKDQYTVYDHRRWTPPK